MENFLILGLELGSDYRLELASFGTGVTDGSSLATILLDSFSGLLYRAFWIDI